MELIDLITCSRRNFLFFTEKCDESYRSGHDLILYRKLIRMHREIADFEALVANDEFIKTVYRTLEEWDMNKRGARLTSFDKFVSSVVSLKKQLLKLYAHKLYDDIYDDLSSLKGTFEMLFCNMKVMDSTRRIVGVSKALHFFLPDLVMPIDSKYTMNAFYGYNKYSSSPKTEFSTFWDIFDKSCEIVERLRLTPEDVDEKLWKQSVPKLIDNAIIGFTKCEKEEILALGDTN